jgi:hypothetical protein
VRVCVYSGVTTFFIKNLRVKCNLETVFVLGSDFVSHHGFLVTLCVLPDKEVYKTTREYF